MRTDRQTDRHDEANSRFFFCNFANALNNQGKIFLFDRSLNYYNAHVKILL